MATPAVPKRVNLRLRIVDALGRPMADTACELDCGGLGPTSEYVRLRTDSAGMLAFAIPAGKPAFLTFFPGSDEPITMELDVRAYGPADEIAGLRARLNNLGYLALASGEDVNAPADKELSRALDRFRFANQIVDDELVPVGPSEPPFDERTTNRLTDIHDRGAAFVPDLS